MPEDTTPRPDPDEQTPAEGTPDVRELRERMQEEMRNRSHKAPKTPK